METELPTENEIAFLFFFSRSIQNAAQRQRQVNESSIEMNKTCSGRLRLQISNTRGFGAGKRAEERWEHTMSAPIDSQMKAEKKSFAEEMKKKLPLLILIARCCCCLFFSAAFFPFDYDYSIFGIFRCFRRGKEREERETNNLGVCRRRTNGKIEDEFTFAFRRRLRAQGECNCYLIKPSSFLIAIKTITGFVLFCVRVFSVFPYPIGSKRAMKLELLRAREQRREGREKKTPNRENEKWAEDFDLRTAECFFLLSFASAAAFLRHRQPSGEHHLRGSPRARLDGNQK